MSPETVREGELGREIKIKKVALSTHWVITSRVHSSIYEAVMPESAHSFTASFIERERKTRVWEKVVRVCKWLTARPNRSHS